MKIALPTRGAMVDDHFGHCEAFTIYTVESNHITNIETLPSPAGCGCKSGVAVTLGQMGVELMLAGNMGEGAKNVLEFNGIKVIRGCHGIAEEVLKAYLEGNVSDSGIGCSAHHTCDHEH
jgi:predicted Fe-Mo cluster-binding NifX family protein